MPPLNSAERHEARYQRRQAKRQANRQKRIENCTLESVADLDNLVQAAKACSKGVKWKRSVQAYMVEYMFRCLIAKRMLLRGEDIRRGYVRFDVWERGKLRHITAVRYSERVIQKSIARNALAPAVWPSMARGCFANIKGCGESYAIAKLTEQLRRWYLKHGTGGYILQVDFADYFGSIRHDKAMEFCEHFLDDKRVLKYLNDQIAAHTNIQGEHIGLGLGSEPNQTIAVALPYRIDYLALRWEGVEASGRYMDDSYYIALDKATLWELLDAIRAECSRFGITINERKTKVVKLSRGFKFLKKRFSYGANGQIVKRLSRDSTTRMRRKLKRFARMIEQGRLTQEQANQSYQSWRGQALHFHSYGAVRRMDALYRRLISRRP